MKGLNRVFRFFTAQLFPDRGEYSWVDKFVTVEVAAVIGVVFCSKIVLAVLAPATVIPCVFWDCFGGRSGGNRSEDGWTEGGVEVVWPVGWVVTSRAAESVGGFVVFKAGEGGSMLGL